METIEIISPVSKDVFLNFLQLKEKQKKVFLEYILLQLGKRVKEINFVDDEGEHVERDDVYYFLENFNVVYVNKNERPQGDHKIYEYSFVNDVLKISCSSASGEKVEHLYNSQMTFEIVENVVNNANNLKQKERNKFYSHPQMQVSNSTSKTSLKKLPEGVFFSELSKHNQPDDYWISINRKVYDISQYFSRHPGGKIILTQAGKEATNMFNQYHPWVNADYILKDYFIGNLKLI